MSLSESYHSPTAKDPQASASFSAQKHPHRIRIPANLIDEFVSGSSNNRIVKTSVSIR